MFGNLKNKLGEAADLKKYGAPQNLVNSLMGSRQRSGTHTPLSHHGQQQTLGNNGNYHKAPSGSVTPLPSVSHSPLSPASSRTHSRQASINSLPLSPGTSPTPPVDNGQHSSPSANQDMAREIKKLRGALEQQQDANVSRLQAKESEWRDKMARYAEKVSHTQEALQKSEITIASLRQDLSMSNQRSEDLYQKLQSMHEERDQMEGLSVQEAAKIKHMLLNTSTELEATRAQLSERISLYGELEKKFVASQNSKDSDIQQLQLRLQQLENERQELDNWRQQHLRLSSSGSGADGEALREMQQQHADRERSLSAQVDEWRLQAERLQQIVRTLEEEKNTQQQHWSLLLEKEQKEKTEDLENMRLSLCREREKGESALQMLAREYSIKEEHTKSLVSSLEQQIRQLKQEQEESRASKEKSLVELQHQLQSLSIRCSDSVHEAEGAKNAHKMANDRCAELQNLLEELQRRTHSQITAEKSNCEKLQSALSVERSEKQTLESCKAELEAKLKVVCGEKGKLSKHLDELANKVTLLEEQKNNDSMIEAEFREEVNNLRDQMRTYEEKVSYYESGEWTQQQEEKDNLTKELQEKVALQEEELNEKSQTIKVQSQRIADMKKTMQRELRLSPDSGNKRVPRPASPGRNGTHGYSHSSTDNGLPSNNGFSSSSPAVLTMCHSAPDNRLMEVPAITKDGPVDPINLEYLKHVVLKFITSKEYEAIHLVKAVTTLLHLSQEETQLLHDTVTWRKSWFGPKPQLVKGRGKGTNS